MQYTPAEVGAMSLWQFLAAADGWAKANSPDAARPTDEDLAAAEALLEAAPDTLH